jgi:hypothetical protein
MWIVFRLVLAVGGFIVRYLSRGWHPNLRREFEGLEYFEKVHSSKKKTLGFDLGADLTTPTWITLHPESPIDRVFKGLGIANEVQTGDAAFDEKVYVTCDHPHVWQVLRATTALREVILHAFSNGYSRIHFDGTVVIMGKRSDRSAGIEDLRLLQRLVKASAPLSGAMPSRWSDPFLWRALAIEAVVWGVAGYAIGGFIQFVTQARPIHVAAGSVVSLGLQVAVLALLLLLGAIVLWMRGSSRGHRVIVESAIVLALTLPIAGIHAVADTNLGLDEATPVKHVRALEGCEVREHRGRRGRRWYSYTLKMVQPPGQAAGDVPDTLRVEKPVCDAAHSGATVEIAVSPGRWGIPWYRSIRVGDVTWNAPL